MKYFVRYRFTLLLLLSFALASVAGMVTAQYSVEEALAAQADPRTELREAGSGFSPDGQSQEPTDIRLFFFRGVQASFGMLGTYMIIMFLYAGYQWWTAGGNEDRVDTAKKTIRNTIIGLLLIASSYALVSFVFDAFFVPMQNNRPTLVNPEPSSSSQFSSTPQDQVEIRDAGVSSPTNVGPLSPTIRRRTD